MKNLAWPFRNLARAFGITEPEPFRFPMQPSVVPTLDATSFDPPKWTGFAGDFSGPAWTVGNVPTWFVHASGSVAIAIDTAFFTLVPGGGGGPLGGNIAYSVQKTVPAGAQTALSAVSGQDATTPQHCVAAAIDGFATFFPSITFADAAFASLGQQATDWALMLDPGDVLVVQADLVAGAGGIDGTANIRLRELVSPFGQG